MKCNTFCTAATIGVLMIAGCRQSHQPAPGSTEPPELDASTIRPGQIVGRPLRSAAGAVGPRFQRFSPDQSGIDFTNRIDTSHSLKRLYHSGFACGGVAIGDVDGDGNPDIYLVSGPGKNRLYRNSDTLRFEDVTGETGVDGGDAWGGGAAMADVDNDGDLDIYVCNYERPNLLYINGGDGRFTEQARQFGVDVVDASLMPAFCDYDADGDLDLYLLTNRLYRAGGRPRTAPFALRDGKPYVLAEYERYYALQHRGGTDYEIGETGRPDRLLRNDGGRFTDVTESAGIYGAGHGLSVTWWDSNSDGLPDIYVGNDFQDPDRLYRNNGDGTFTNVLKETIPHTTWFSMGADAADINNDGRLDLLIADMAATNHYKQKTMMGAMNAERILRVAGPPPQVMRNACYLSTGAERFMEIAYLAGIADTNWTWAVKFGDYDNDGRVDLAVTNGMARQFNHSDSPLTDEMLVGRNAWDYYENKPPLLEQNLMFRNGADLEFQDVSQQWGFDHVGMSYAAAIADLDRDGDLDIVVVNLEEPASVYRNNSSEGHRLLVRLVGTQSNRFGIGARVTIETAAGIQVRELSPMTGFLSCNEPIIQFGLGDQTMVDRLVVRWPNGGEQVFTDIAADKQYTIAEPSGKPAKSTVKPAPRRQFVQSSMFTPLRHLDKPFDDFQLQPLLPNKLSQLGPGIAWGDVDGDGDEDGYLGRGAGFAGALLIRGDDGRFRERRSKALAIDSNCEDMGALFFDADGDDDLDLYVVSGGVESEIDSVRLRDRLYVNDGEGNLQREDDALPDVRDSGSVVCAADFDRDGDLDLFVGGRVIPGRYPLPPSSRLLRNDGGIFKDVTGEVAPKLLKTGLVTGALWSDADGDGWIDLLVTHEWGPVKLYRNVDGKLHDVTKTAGLDDMRGWWNGIAAGDFDRDGDMDYVVTNFGLNTKYHASAEKPALLYYGDFEGKGRMRLVEAEYEDKTLFPVRGKSCSTHAMPHLGEQFKSFHEFALASVGDIYTPECLAKAYRFAATELQSGVLINDGMARFEFRPLPRIAQIAPAFGVCVCEVNGDGNPDIYTVQNFFSPQPETGRMAGGLSQLLLGRGDATFSAVAPKQSGLVVPGDAKSLVQCDLNDDGWPDFLVGINDGEAQAFVHAGSADGQVRRVRLRGPKGNRDAVGARVQLVLSDRSVQTHDVHAGSGYLSQSAPNIVFGLPYGVALSEMRIRWPDGTTQRVELDGRELDDVVSHP